MNILHISDIHYCRSYKKAEDGYESVLYKMESPLKALAKCFDDYTRIYGDPDVIAITGDLTEDGSKEDYSYLKAYIKNRMGDVPVVVTMGNHDNKENFRAGWLEEEQGSGSYNEVYNIGGIDIISWDSAQQGNPNGNISDKQLHWLSEAVKKSGDRPKILMTHHHFLDGHENIPSLSCDERLKEMIRDNNFICILCGHTHHQFLGLYEGCQYYTADGMSFYGTNLPDGRVRFEERYGYNALCIDKGMVFESGSRHFSNGKIITDIYFK